MIIKNFDLAIKNTNNINDKLNDDEKQLRLNLIQQIINTNKPIIFEDKYQPLLEKDILQIQNQKIDIVYPFALHKTNKVVKNHHNNKSYYAMCAIDALGMYFTINEPIEIMSECELTKEPIHLVIHNDHIHIETDNKDIRVLFTELSNDKQWSNNCCNKIHFFKDSLSLNKYVERYCWKDSKFYDLSLNEAFGLSKKIFNNK